MQLITLTKLTTLALTLLTLTTTTVTSLDNGLGKTPPMGWNSWNKFKCDVDEHLIKTMADSIVAFGLAQKGYTYVNIDDCWQVARDDMGRIVPDPKRFPSGMKALGDYIHKKGLKFGIYSDAGTMTCEKRPGSLGYEDIDAQTYASWGVDFLKYDNCYNQNLPHRPRYEKMRDALNATGRPIFYSICNWGLENVWEWGTEVGNSWRTTGDIWDKFDFDGVLCPCKDTVCPDGQSGAECSVLNILEKQKNITEYSGIGGWNDPDMLEIGNGGMTYSQYQTHFSFWAALKSPLIMGHDIRSMTAQTYEILANEEVIAINQDPLGKSIKYLYTDPSNGVQIWAGPLANGDSIVLAFNPASRWLTVPIRGFELDLVRTVYKTGFVKESSSKRERVVCARDLWGRRDVGCGIERLVVPDLEPNGVALLRLRLIE